MAKQLFSSCCWISVPVSTLRRRFLITTAPSFFPPSRRLTTATAAERSVAAAASSEGKKEKEKKKKKAAASARREKEKRRTRSDKEYDVISYFNGNVYNDDHFPVMLGEVVDVFSSLRLRSFVDCTLGAAGHSSAIMESHPELRTYMGLDVDPIAHVKARARLDEVLKSRPELKAETLVKNFRWVKSALAEVDGRLLQSGVDAILMDLGMSSMQVNSPERGFSVVANGPLDMRMDPQASLKAEDILNSWPDMEVGRIIKEYGEESNWHLLQKKIVQARLRGGLHSTGELRDLIQSMTGSSRGGRQGWIKTATRVFQALRIAVNNELNTLEKSLCDCFECLAPGGRLAVISFHSLEDRIVKQTFLNIIGSDRGEDDGDEEDERVKVDTRKITNETDGKELWIRQVVRGHNGTILTKRPITPCEEEERLNRRCRSAKLRVIEKVG